MTNNLKQKIAVVRGRWSDIKQRDADLNKSSFSYWLARFIVMLALMLVWFCIKVFGAFIVAGFGGNPGAPKRGSYASREEIEARQSGAPAYYDNDYGGYMGPNSRD